MPKRTKYPGLRRHSWTTAQGERVTAYYYEQRTDGKRREIPLGTDHAEALRKWHELTFDRPREAGTLKEAFDRWQLEALPAYEKARTRRDYALCLTKLRAAMERARWEDIDFPGLKTYLNRRTAKTRANRELSVLSIIWNWARGEGLTPLPFPAAGMSRAKWKNRESPRVFEVTDALFAAVYAKADQVLRDCMDIASATALRLTDVCEVALPSDGVLRGKASKTGKRFAVDMTASPVLRPLLERRRAMKPGHLKLLSTPTRDVSYLMLRDRWNEAREAAASDPANAAIADDLRAMFLRDMRSRAADLADSLEDAAELLQHQDKRLTDAHYRTRVKVIKSVR